MRRLVLLALLWLALAPVAFAQPIDRHALVARHSPTLTAIDPHAPVMLGNGDIGFTADITGLQTFPEAYSKLAPLLTMAQWAWHSFPNPNGWTEADGMVPVAVPGRGDLPYPYIRDWAEVDRKPALKWLRENPHRVSLGRMALTLRARDGRSATVADLSQTRQTLDLWRGVLTSHFIFDGEPVTVETRVHPDQDAVMVDIRSALVADGRLGVAVRYPGVSPTLNPDPSDWTRPEAHTTRVLQRARDNVLVERRLDATVYLSRIAAPGGRISAVGPHAFQVQGRSERLTAIVAYGRDRAEVAPVDVAAARKATADAWRAYWTDGGVIDFSGSTDPRADELERRVVLSQYLQAINASGELPPQEEGLFSNSWNGKFHLEMPPWHSGHFAAWGRPERLERVLGWYLTHLPKARAEAAMRRVEGAWWPKMVGPEGRNSPSTINPFIMWQQPHPIFMAELTWRARRDPAALERYAPLVEDTARLLASWPTWDEAGRRYVLGPPIIPVQENHPPLTTVNPVFEVEYFRWGLQTAQAWRERRGLPREPAWDRVIADLAPLPRRDGLYLPVENAPDFWRQAASPACRGHAVEGCMNRDHPSFLMAYGFIGGDRVDRETMRRTLRAVEANWDVRQTWGWDFPMVAMTAARLGEPESALAWLFRDLPNNRWGVTGMTPRVHLDEHAQAFLPDAPGGTDGPGYRRAAETYFPSNGSLLLAVGMMAAGWEGSQGHAPGFPREGWVVRHEGLLPLP